MTELRDRGFLPIFDALDLDAKDNSAAAPDVTTAGSNRAMDLPSLPGEGHSASSVPIPAFDDPSGTESLEQAFLVSNHSDIAAPVAPADGGHTITPIVSPGPATAEFSDDFRHAVDGGEMPVIPSHLAALPSDAPPSPSASSSSPPASAPPHDPAAASAPAVVVHHSAEATAGDMPHATPAAGGDPSGQLWFGGEGLTSGTSSGISDSQIGRIDSDGNGHAVADVNTTVFEGAEPDFIAVGLDTAAGLYFTLNGDGTLRAGHFTTTSQTDQSSEIQQIQMIFGTGVNADEVNALAVDPVHDVIYVGLWGQTQTNTGILEVTYNPATGAMSSPYNGTTGTLSNFNHVLLSNISSGGTYVNATAMQYDVSNNKLYYIDQTNGTAINDGAGATWHATNGIYATSSTTGSVGTGNAPTTTELTLNSQFAAGDNNNYVSGFVVDDAQSMIYFTVNNASNSSSTLWRMSINGGTATQMSMPSGVTLNFASYFGSGSNPLALDANSQTLFISQNTLSGAGGRVTSLQLAANGLSFTSGTDNFFTLDSNLNHEGAATTGLTYDSLPKLASVSGTSTEAVQGGSAVTLLTGAPSITDPDGVALAGVTVKVTNGQTGDALFVNGTQTASQDGGKVTVSFNSTTHTLTLTGDDSLAAYQTLLSEVTFQDTGTDNSSGSHPTRTLVWVANDGVTLADPTTSDPNEATTTLTIDRAPTVGNDSANLLEGATATATAGSGLLSNDSDLDGDTVTLQSVKNASNVSGSFGSSLAGTYGHLTLQSTGAYSYTADNTSAIDGAATGSHPQDVFTYIDSDGLGGTTSGTLTFTIDRAPTLGADSYPVLESGSATGTSGTAGTGVLGNDSDKDGDSLTVTAVNSLGGDVGVSTAGTYGHLNLAANGSFTYTANTTGAIDSAPIGSHPVDTFTYTVSDGHGGSTTQNVSFTIDRAPTLGADSYSLLESASATGTSGTGGTGVLGNDSDKDGDTLTVTAVNGSGGNVGSSSFAGTYGHFDLAANGSFTYSADNTAAIDAATVGSHPTDTFTYTVSDGHGGSATQNVSFTIDRAPILGADSYAAVEGASASGTAGTGGTGVLGNDSDKDGDTLTVSAVNGSAGNVGSSSFAGTYGHFDLAANGSFTYSADNTAAIDAATVGSHPTDTFTYTVADGHGGSTTQDVSFTIDRAPVLGVDSYATVEGASASGTAGTGGTGVLGNDSDKDGDTLTVSAVNGSAGNVGSSSFAGTYGHLNLAANGSFTYTADNTAAIDAAATGSHPTDSFTYTVSDGNGGSTTQNVSFTIDRAPVGVADSATVFGGATDTVTAGSGVLSNDTDKDGDTLTVSAVNGSAGNVGTSIAGTYGHLTLNSDGGYTYSADNAGTISAAADDATLTDSFTYTASDGNGGTTADTTLTVTIDQAPIVTGFSAVATSGADFTTAHTVTFTLATGKDVDVAAGTTLTLSDGGTATYVSGTGTESIVFTESAIVAPSDTLQVTGIGAGSIADAAGNPLAIAGTTVSSYTDTVSDTAAHLSAHIDSLEAAIANIDTVTDSDSGALSITQAQFTADAAFLDKIVGAYDVIVTDATGTSPETGASGTAPPYSSLEDVYDASHTLTQTIYFNDDGTQTVTGMGATQTVDDSASTQNDFIDLSNSTTATATGGSGNDGFYFGAAFNATDTVDGGAGTNNQIGLDGDYAGGVTLDGTHLSNVQVIALLPGFDYDLTAAANLLGAAQSMTIWATDLAAGNTVHFDGAAVTSGGSFTLIGGAGDDTLIGGAGNDKIYGLGGADTLTGNGGVDTFAYSKPADLTGTGHDTITDFDALTDQFQFTHAVAAIDTPIASGMLDTGATFDTELALAVNPTNLAAHDAVLFTPNTGNLAGHTFLVVDANGTPGYQAGADYVIDITGATNLASLSTTHFIA